MNVFLPIFIVDYWQLFQMRRIFLRLIFDRGLFPLWGIFLYLSLNKLTHKLEMKRLFLRLHKHHPLYSLFLHRFLFSLSFRERIKYLVRIHLQLRVKRNEFLRWLNPGLLVIFRDFGLGKQVVVVKELGVGGGGCRSFLDLDV